MVRIHKILALLVFLVPAAAYAQSQPEPTETPMEYDFHTRTSAGINWKIIKGLHMDASYELRTNNCCTHIQRHLVNVGINWSPIKYFSLGGGYYFIAHFKSDNTYQPRHRVYLDLTGSYKFGQWKLSLRERVQYTHKAYDVNTYQQNPNLVELRSRLKVSYKGFIHLEPYAYMEMCNCFNDPSFTGDYDASSGKYLNYQFTGYNDAYVNMVRGSLGLQWNIDRHNSIDFKVLLDWCHDKKIDVNQELTKVKSYTWKSDFNTSLGIAYVYAF